MEIKRKMPDGSVRHFLGRTAAECEKKYRDALVNFEAQQRARTEGPLFGVLADEWWAAKEGQVRHGTVRCYKPAVARLKKALGDLPAAQLTAQEVSRLLEDMKRRGLATKTISNTHTVLNMILEYGAVEYGLTSNPSRLVSTPTSRKKKRKPPSEPAEQAIRSLLNQAAESQKVDDAILIGAVLLYTGCRRGEALALRFGDIDRAENRITVSASVEHRGNRPVRGEPKTENGYRVCLCCPSCARSWRPTGGEGRNVIFLAAVLSPLQTGSFPIAGSNFAAAAAWPSRWSKSAKAMAEGTEPSGTPNTSPWLHPISSATGTPRNCIGQGCRWMWPSVCWAIPTAR